MFGFLTFLQKLCFYVSLFIIFSSLNLNAQVLELNQEVKTDSSINQFVYYTYNSLRKDLPAQAIKKRFLNIPNKGLEMPISQLKGVYWFKLTIKNNTNRFLRLYLFLEYFDVIQLYNDDASPKKLWKGGIYENPPGIEFAEDRVIIPLNLPSRQTKTFYIRAINESYKSGVIKPILINQQKYQYQNLIIRHKDAGFVATNFFLAGIAFFLLIFAFFNYLFLKDNVYIFYGLYVFGITLYLLLKLESSLLFSIITARVPDILYINNEIIPLLAFVALIEFQKRFLKKEVLTKGISLLYKYSQIVMILLIVILIILKITLHNPALEWQIFTVYRIVTIFAFFYLVISFFRSHDTLARITAFSSVLLMIGMLLSLAASIAGTSYNNSFTEYPLLYMEIGTSLEIICFAFGLSFKNKLNDTEKHLYQEELIQSLEDYNALQNTLNYRLEQMVENKTHTIIRQTELLEKEQERKLKADFDRQIAEVKLEALRSQMNPHFVFNSMNSINHYILSNDAESASLYLTKFSRLIRLFLDDSRNASIALNTEIMMLKLYLEIESIRFEQPFDFEIIAENSLTVNNYCIPTMVIQPFIENAIWHGLFHKEEKGNLLINFFAKLTEPDYIFCEITDNGIGRNESRAINNKNNDRNVSHGLTVTHERLKLYENDNTLEIKDLYNEAGEPAGTKVILKIKSVPC